MRSCAHNNSNNQSSARDPQPRQNDFRTRIQSVSETLPEYDSVVINLPVSSRNVHRTETKQFNLQALPPTYDEAVKIQILQPKTV